MVLSNDYDLLNPPAELEKRKHKLKRLVQSPNSFFMDVKCQGCFNITTVFSHSQTVVVCGNCQTVLCQPTGGRARLTEGCSFRRKVYTHYQNEQPWQQMWITMLKDSFNDFTLTCSLQGVTCRAWDLRSKADAPLAEHKNDHRTTSYWLVILIKAITYSSQVVDKSMSTEEIRSAFQQPTVWLSKYDTDKAPEMDVGRSEHYSEISFF
ncbi:40S ribosomal protein S27-2 [Sesamum angolense]|uniref:40S ribosomal protein S27 n=1 Tax=Sesamum angolense TaxID=2727404 RepID=A0AAE2BJP9_9LAMI|nr:40S ribosomal protein S27-2 [Sesamum angolense]